MPQKFNVYLSDREYDRLQGLSAEHDRPMADVLREAIWLLDYMAREIAADGRFGVQRPEGQAEIVLPLLEGIRPR